MKKLIGVTSIIILVGLSILFALYNPIKSKEIGEVLYGVSYYPEGFIFSQEVHFQNRVQQHIVLQQNSREKIIFETIVKNIDSVNLVDYKEVLIQENKGVSYTYGSSGNIQYSTYDDKLMTKLETPKEGDDVLEWSNKEYDFRIFGNIGIDELILIAESIPQ